ncbi:MAG: FAD-dependent oxidoreductase [Anaerolineae bacterium]|nr:FAD-dependent oxidoreductase [Anaerolineae bacterium]
MVSLARIDTEVDVLVVGGGTAGAIAATQAARAGATVAVLERGPQLGGTMSTGGVAFPGLFHAWGRQIIAGIGWELVLRTVALGGGTLPDFSQPCGDHHWLHQILLDGALYAAIAEEACLEAGVGLCYYEIPTAVRREGGHWLVETLGKGMRRRITCAQLIDCTGDADVVAMAGFPRIRGETRQPGTLLFRLGGYDVARLDPTAIEARYREALAQGDLCSGDVANVRAPFLSFLRSGGNNAQHVFGADSATSQTQTAANIAGRQSLLRLLRFVRTLPGCEGAYLVTLASETAVRETYRIAGETTVTVDDYISGHRFPDTVCYAFYPVDVHTEAGVEPRQLQPGVVPTVPLAALIPKGSDNLLVAGRCISSDRLANSALRVQAPCMAMGQAAGAAAALAVRRNTTPGTVPYADLAALLRAHAAIVP